MPTAGSRGTSLPSSGTSSLPQGAPRPQATPRPSVSAPGSRPTAAPSQSRPGQFGQSQPGAGASRGATQSPGYVPAKPAQNIPGYNRPTEPLSPSPVGGAGKGATRPDSAVSPAVGGSVRSNTGAPRPSSTPQATPRDIYERGSKGAGRSEGSGLGTKPQRPLTTDVVADRYRPRSNVVPGRPDAMKTPAADAARPTAKPAQPGAVQRFQPKPDAARGGQPRGEPTRGQPQAGSTPKLSPRSGGVGTTASGAPTPRLNPRTAAGSTFTGKSATLTASCYGPVWDPYWNASYAPYYGSCGWSPALTWCIGIGWGSFGWGWSSCYPWYWYGSYCGPYWGWGWGWSSWYRPWWPAWAYVPAVSYVDYVEPVQSSVVVVERTVTEVPATETIQVGRAAQRSAAPAELARKYVALGDFYFREGRFAEAADAYARAKTYAPEDGTVHFALADAVFASGDYHFAAFLIGEGLRLDPSLATADTDKRLLYGDVGLFESQMQTLLRYLEDKPYDAMAHLVLGHNLKFSGRPQEAEKAFRRVLEIDPGNIAAQRFLAAMNAPADTSGR